MQRQSSVLKYAVCEYDAVCSQYKLYVNRIRAFIPYHLHKRTSVKGISKYKLKYTPHDAAIAYREYVDLK